MGNMFDPPGWNGNSGSAVSGMLDGVTVDAASGNYAESLVAAGAKALDTDGDLRASRHWFELAYRMAQSAGDPHVMAVAALGLGGLWTDQHRAVLASGVFEVRLRQALSLIEPRSALGIRLRVRLAAEADYRAGGQTAILAVLEEARETTARPPPRRAPTGVGGRADRCKRPGRPSRRPVDECAVADDRPVSGRKTTRAASAQRVAGPARTGRSLDGWPRAERDRGDARDPGWPARRG